MVWSVVQFSTGQTSTGQKNALLKLNMEAINHPIEKEHKMYSKIFHLRFACSVVGKTPKWWFNGDFPW